MNTDKLKTEFPELGPRERLREAILYVAAFSNGDPTFGATKLNKILLNADQLSYKRYGKPITGVAYMRQPYGPVPRPIKGLLDEMEAKTEIFNHAVAYHNYVQKRVLALRLPNLSAFDAKDIAILNEVIALLRDKSASEVSAMSHTIAWQAALDGEDIPYNTAFVAQPTITEDDISEAQNLAREFGWSASV